MRRPCSPIFCIHCAQLRLSLPFCMRPVLLLRAPAFPVNSILLYTYKATPLAYILEAPFTPSLLPGSKWRAPATSAQQTPRDPNCIHVCSVSRSADIPRCCWCLYHLCSAFSSFVLLLLPSCVLPALYLGLFSASFLSPVFSFL